MPPSCGGEHGRFSSGGGPVRSEGLGGFDPASEPAGERPKERPSGEKRPETRNSALFHRRQRAEQVPARP